MLSNFACNLFNTNGMIFGNAATDKLKKQLLKFAMKLIVAQLLNS